ncbi:MAG TPA: serine hydrolase domain-containing protein [Symbiobacteriaceae bacterium]|nr:serine hydrolase domain-containing protein [Symbiobacteriaceae bacterium]
MARTLLAVLLASALIAAALPAAAGEATPTDLSAIDQLIGVEMKAAHIPGVSLGIVRDGEVIYTKGYGEASPGRPMLASTPMVLGPISEAVTAAAVLQLAEAGKLDLDAPVTRYMPWFRLGGSAGSDGGITVRHLLAHTSGLTAADSSRPLLDDGTQTLEESVYSLRDVAPAGPPGEAFRPSSLNYDLLGLVVQTVSGQPFGEYLRTKVFTPLQMKRSFTDQAPAIREFMAEGYQIWLGLATPSAAPYLKNSVPSRYIISTAEDMARFVAAGLKGSTAETGFTAREMAGLQTLTRGGSTPSFQSQLVWIPDVRTGFVLLTNGQHPLSGAAMARMSEGIAAALSGRPVAVPSWWHHSAWVLYDVAYLGASGLVIWSLESIRRWRQRLAAAAGRAWQLGLIAVGLHLALAAGLTFGVPLLAGGSWANLQLFAPDLGRLAAGAVIANFIGAGLRVWITITTPHKRIDTIEKESALAG